MLYKFVPTSDSDYATATSYLSIEEMTSLMLGNEHKNTWDNNDIKVNEILLMRASLWVDGLYQYNDFQTSDTQLLKFPRGGSKVVPEAVKYAVATLCVDVFEQTLFENLRQETIGKLTVQFFKTTTDDNTELSTLLRPYVMNRVKITG